MQPLTGQGKPFHSALDKAAALLKRKVGTGQEFMKELQGLGGIKQAEMDERKLAALLGMPKMTHEQFMSELASRPIPAIHEKVLGEQINEDFVKELAQEYAYEAALDSLYEDGVRGNLASDLAKDMAKENYREYWDEAMREVGKGSGATYHGDYTLPGGENYREMLIKAPEGSEQFGGLRYHYNGEPGILASMRLKDRLIPDLEGEHNVKIIGGGGASNKKFKTRAEAEAFANVKHQGGYRTELTPLQQKKLLHLEELQSDWHQRGREHGYHQNLTELPSGYQLKENVHPSGFSDYSVLNDQGKLMASGVTAETATKNALENLNRGQRVPEGPFKKNWEEMALKRLIHHAAEKGYHGVLVTPGDVQADRYSLAKQISSLGYNPEEGHLQAYGHDRRQVFNEKNIPQEKVADYIGKEAADRLFSTPKQGKHHLLEGENIKVGGEGMKGFYDKKVPNILNAIGKKHRVKVTQISHSLGHDEESKKRINDAYARGTREDIANANAQSKQQTVNLHHFPITEDMRKDILANGLPMYHDGGKVDELKDEFMKRAGMADGGSAAAQEAKAKLDQLKQEFMQLAERDSRAQKAAWNAEQMANKKAKGGSAREKAFKQFMKGTKAKERVYHGTGNLENLEAFDPAMTGKGNDQLGSGFYFTTHPDEASGYAGNYHQSSGKQNKAPGVIPAHLAIRKPIKIGPKGSSLNDARINLSHDQIKQIMAHAPDIMHPERSPLGNHVDVSRGVTPNIIHDIAKLYTGNALHAMENDLFADNPTAYRKALNKVLGYDGVIKDFGDGRKHYVAWFPEQIKSAIGNRGTYDPTNPDLTMAKGGNVSTAGMRYALTMKRGKKHG